LAEEFKQNWVLCRYAQNSSGSSCDTNTFSKPCLRNGIW
jgi:hypothetical protein